MINNKNFPLGNKLGAVLLSACVCMNTSAVVSASSEEEASENANSSYFTLGLCSIGLLCAIGGIILTIAIPRGAAAQRKAQAAEARRQAQGAEAQRLAQEAEAQRQAQAAEARRQAEEAEAQRLAQEAEAQRQAQAAEAQRLAQEAETQRRAEARRLAQEAETQRRAEARRWLDEAAAERQRLNGMKDAFITLSGLSSTDFERLPIVALRTKIGNVIKDEHVVTAEEFSQLNPEEVIDLAYGRLVAYRSGAYTAAAWGLGATFTRYCDINYNDENLRKNKLVGTVAT